MGNIILASMCMIYVQTSQRVATIQSVTRNFVFEEYSLIYFSMFLDFLVDFLYPLSYCSVVYSLIFRRIRQSRNGLLKYSSLGRGCLMIVQGIRGLTGVFLYDVGSLLGDYASITRFRGERSYTIVVRRLVHCFFRCFL